MHNHPGVDKLWTCQKHLTKNGYVFENFKFYLLQDDDMCMFSANESMRLTIQNYFMWICVGNSSLSGQRQLRHVYTSIGPRNRSAPTGTNRDGFTMGSKRFS